MSCEILIIIKFFKTNMTFVMFGLLVLSQTFQIIELSITIPMKYERKITKS